VNSSGNTRTHATLRQRVRIVLAIVVTTALTLVVSMVASTARSGPVASAASESHGYPYSIGSPMLALKLTRMQMLTSQIGVGVAPIVTFSGGLVRAYLVRTDDGGSSWIVTGVLPKGFYPWTTAFSSPREDTSSTVGDVVHRQRWAHVVGGQDVLRPPLDQHQGRRGVDSGRGVPQWCDERSLLHLYRLVRDGSSGSDLGVEGAD